MIPVACCLIRNEKGQILLAQKASGLWEFPGGKQDEGETLFECAEREILEELGVIISANKAAGPRHIVGEAPKLYELILVSCDYLAGDIALTEHLEAKWFSSSEISEDIFCPGDRVLYNSLLASLNS